MRRMVWLYENPPVVAAGTKKPCRGALNEHRRCRCCCKVSLIDDGMKFFAKPYRCWWWIVLATRVACLVRHEGEDPHPMAFLAEAREAAGAAVPAVPGLIMAGKTQRDLSKEITGAVWDELPRCTWYKEHPGTCIPDDPLSPCRYCRAPHSGFFGSAECPPDESFRSDLVVLYEWRLKPHKRKTSGGTFYLCVVQPREGPIQPQQVAAFPLGHAYVPSSCSVALGLSIMLIAIAGGF